MEKTKSLENKIDEFERGYVTHKHMDAVVSPLQRMAEEIQRDVKKLLVLVTKRPTSHDEA